MEYREFRISKELRPYISVVLMKQSLPFKFKKKDDQYYISVPLSGEKFHKVVLKARAEKLTHDTGTLYLTNEDADNPILVESLFPGGNAAFHRLGK